MRYKLAVIMCAASVWVSILMVVIFVRIIITGQCAIAVEPITPIAVFELVFFTAIAVISVICFRALWKSTGKNDGHCPLCRNKLKRRGTKQECE